MFSVIIPLYNKAPYIEKAIRSVAAQTFKEFELIVIDDGSTDIEAPQPPKGGVGLTYSHIEQLIDGKGKLIKQKNSGVSMTRNNGVAMAKYDYIAFLDADDWWAPTYLEEMKALIEKYPEAGIYASAYNIVKNKTQRLARIGVDADFGAGIINYFKVYAQTLEMPVWTGATIIKKNIFIEQKGFKPNLKLGEDFDLWVLVAIKHPVAFLNKPLAYYNQDVDLGTRAVGVRLYEPHEHMLFTEYEPALKQHPDFQYLFQRLTLYGLLSYYKEGVLKQETKVLLSQIDWKKHERKYYVYYKILTPYLVKVWFRLLNMAYRLKQRIKQ